jgi:ADP-ribosylation factor-like protein 2
VIFPLVVFDLGLLKIIRKIKKTEKEMRLLMLGLDNAGKTTVLMTFCGDDISEIPPTVGFNIKTVSVRDFKVNIWDVGGQKSIRSFWRNYFDTTDGLVWVVDSTDRHRLMDCKRELAVLLGEEKLRGSSLLILANKQDLQSALSLEDIAKVLELDTIKSSRECAVYSCSALDGGSVHKALDWIIDDIGSRMYSLRY